MRRCMKNFNFKLDYNEIDRIIEEQEEGGNEDRLGNLITQLDEEQKVIEPIASKSPRPITGGQARKQWDKRQPEEKKVKQGVRI